MSINGVLEDLSLADVVQFIHIGQRTGTLYLWRDDRERAEIGFMNGRIVSTWRPERPPLGDRLVAEGLVEPSALARALAAQKAGSEHRSIGQLLVAGGALKKVDLYRLLKVQITDTIFELVTWRQGRFHFEVDELNPLDDFACEPESVLEDLELNTQMLLLEATRIFDERQSLGRQSVGRPLERPRTGRARSEGKAGAGPTGARPRAAGDWAAGDWASEHDASTEPPAPVRSRTRPLPAVPAPAKPLDVLRCQVVTDNRELVPALRQAIPTMLARVVGVTLREAGNRLPGEGASPLVILDLRTAGDRAAVAQLARTRPAAPVVVLAAHAEQAAAAYRVGAVAGVTGLEELVHAVRSLVRVLSHPQPHGTFGYGSHGGFGRFRRVVFEVQSGLISVTMALNLMHAISESVDRAILFLVRGQRMVAVGAFGFARDGLPLAETTRGLRLAPAEGSALRRVCVAAEPIVSSFRDAHLPAGLADLIGAPASDQAVVFPVLGAERVISVIYTDNGSIDEPIQDIQILELATAQVGVALENELMQQEFSDRNLAAWLDGDAAT